ncbi:MAG: hypothetical protein QM780_06860 [Hyphomicrobium sp.]|uniref:hypothetical protein n=1 Tax=Hyphomicrobium sp. TaxID=82 RepID=UPI0039E68A50
MTFHITSAKGLATLTGAGILFAATNANILQTGGWQTSHAILVASLSLGVFAGARVIGQGAGQMALVIIAALAAGETYNFFATGERTVVEREAGAAPLRDALAKHTAAVVKLAALEQAEPTSARLNIARQAKADADDAVTKEASDGCKSECRRKQGLADKAQAELVAAVAEAEQMHQAGVEAARDAVEANPLPASATPLADRIGWAPWALDLFMAALLSFGSNGLAGVLIAFGAASDEEKGSTDRAQTDFNPENLHHLIRFFRPDQDNGNGGSGFSPSPKPGPIGPTGLSKEQALADLLDRLGQGLTIPSQDTLASDWGRPKQTVSDWLKEWRRIGIIPPPIRTGRFKATVGGRCKATIAI